MISPVPLLSRNRNWSLNLWNLELCCIYHTVTAFLSTGGSWHQPRKIWATLTVRCYMAILPTSKTIPGSWLSWLVMLGVDPFVWLRRECLG